MHLQFVCVAPVYPRLFSLLGSKVPCSYEVCDIERFASWLKVLCVLK